MKSNSRRRFIKGMAATGAGVMIVPRHVLGGPGFVAPSDRVNVGIVGAGGQSMYSVRELMKLDNVRLVSVADPMEHQMPTGVLYGNETGRVPFKKLIEEGYAEKSIKQKISIYEDFREMLEKEKSIDAIVCASPDNTHAHISITSMRAGKHIYTEKPMCHNIWEARKMREVAKETGLATQMGNQGHAADALRTTVEYLRAGVIGDVKEVNCWVGATRWNPGLKGLPTEPTPVPEGLNWDLWLGPTEFQEYHESFTPITWRDFWKFGAGALGDFGCHDMDVAVWGLDLADPTSVQVFPAGNRRSKEIAPFGEIGHYYFPATDKRPEVKLNWYSGGLQPELPPEMPSRFTLEGRGTMFVGEKGVIVQSGGMWSEPLVFPLELGKSFKKPDQTIPRVASAHHREWIDEITGGPQALSNFDYASRLTEITLLGVLSLRMRGQKIEWDAENMKVKGWPSADELIKEPVRAGWEMN
ncbi:MAG: Gfo/Idh/MocA family oxidoreductase [Cyclobacteriaceae bacterium]